MSRLAKLRAAIAAATTVAVLVALDAGSWIFAGLVAALGAAWVAVLKEPRR